MIAYITTIPKRIWFTLAFMVIIPFIIVIEVWSEDSSFIKTQPWKQWGLK